jgi:acyl phosphate:glycerol-3-phosphate acyltransferase
METYVLVLIAYMIGSIPTGYIVGSLAGVDVRKAGSGNVGATNVARVVGRRQGIFTFFADAAKGFVPVIVALTLGLGPAAVAAVGMGAFLGHLYPVFLNFRGGKGVATALGVFLALAPWAAVVLIVVFMGIFATTRLVSLSSMAAAVCAPIVLWLFSCPPAWIFMSLLMAVMVTLRHRGNIQRLLSGTEPRFGATSSR